LQDRHLQEGREMNEQTVIEPVVKSVHVGLPVEAAFDLFTAGMHRWWPLHIHSLAVDAFEVRVTAESVVFEQSQGGRIYEVMSDGREGDWGSVLHWERPTRVVFSWKPNLTDNPPTEIEVRFTATAEGTQVELEHRGWERLGDLALQRREGYQTGWTGLLDLFRTAALDRPEAT
jgi:uncharacterized protein YndB with AHSA1/START domain